MNQEQMISMIKLSMAVPTLMCIYRVCKTIYDVLEVPEDDVI